MTETDAVMTRIGAGIELVQRGDRDSARSLFTKVWDDIGSSGDPIHRCAVAHWMADVQDDVHEELVWDLRALEAADLITETAAARAGMASPVSAMYPSLHLNLGEAYRELGELERAREHLRRGRAAADALGEDGYAQMINGGLARLADRLADH